MEGTTVPSFAHSTLTLDSSYHDAFYEIFLDKRIDDHHGQNRHDDGGVL